MKVMESEILKQFKYLTIVQNILGFNRIYLLTEKKYLEWISYLYGVVLIGVSITYMTSEKIMTRPHLWMMIFISGTYILLVLSTILTSKTKLLDFYTTLTKFDAFAKIDQNLVNFRRFEVIGVIFCFAFHFSEVAFVNATLSKSYRPIAYMKMVPWFISQELEQLFHICNLRHIYLRLVILKLKVTEMYRADKDNLLCLRNYGVEIPGNKGELDISGLHTAYDTLHKCAVKLNSAMKVSMLIILPSTGIISVVSLNILNIAIVSAIPTTREKIAIVSGMAMQTLRLFVSFTLPCYYCACTAKEVSNIRSILYESIRRKTLAPRNSTKVKSFLELIKDSTFTYKLLGAITLDMSLPLRFVNACFTYFMISLSFNKIIYNFTGLE